MENKMPCDKHEEQIKTLFKRVDDMGDLRDVIHNLDKNIAVQTQTLEMQAQTLKEIKEHNDKQDKRMDEQHKTIVKINENLTELTEGQRTLNNRVGKLEDRVEENDAKHSIDLRDIDKGKNTNILIQWATPISIGMAVGMLILEVIKVFK